MPDALDETRRPGRAVCAADHWWLVTFWFTGTTEDFTKYEDPPRCPRCAEASVQTWTTHINRLVG